MTTLANAGSVNPPVTRKRGGAVRRLLPLALFAAALAAVFASGLHGYLSLEAVAEHREALAALVAQNAALAALGFVAVYALATALSVPGATVLTVLGGLLFGNTLGTALVVLAATLGATALFLIARGALGDLLRRKAGPRVQQMEAGFRDNALSYLLVLRLVPLFPFWLVNLVPALLGVPLRTFVAATALGIVPGSYVYTSVGAGLGSVLDQGGEVTLAGALTPEVVTALLGLALLSLVPVAYKRLKGRSGG